MTQVVPPGWPGHDFFTYTAVNLEQGPALRAYSVAYSGSDRAKVLN